MTDFGAWRHAYVCPHCEGQYAPLCEHLRPITWLRYCTTHDDTYHPMLDAPPTSSECFSAGEDSRPCDMHAVFWVLPPSGLMPDGGAQP